MNSKLPLLVLSALLLLTGCKSSYKTDYDTLQEAQPLYPVVDPDAPFVGLTLDIASRYVSDAKGLFVLGVFQHSPAYQAGLHSGDLLLRYGAISLDTPNDMDTAMTLIGVRSVEVTVLRGEREWVLEIQPITERSYNDQLFRQGSEVLDYGHDIQAFLQRTRDDLNNENSDARF